MHVAAILWLLFYGRSRPYYEGWRFCCTILLEMVEGTERERFAISLCTEKSQFGFASREDGRPRTQAGAL